MLDAVAKYCGCGNKADMRCVRCGTPTCTYQDPAHEVTFRGVSVGGGFTADATASHWRGRGVCPDCVPALAEDELHRYVLPAAVPPGESVFEQACAVAYLNYPLLTMQFPARRLIADAELSWSVKGWRGPLFDAMVARDFARDFAAAASHHGATTQQLKLGLFRRTDAFPIRVVGTDSEALLFLVPVDGSALYTAPTTIDGKFGRVSPDALMPIPPGAAVALRLM